MKTDAQLLDALHAKEEVQHLAGLDAAKITIEVHDGIVTLRGVVQSLQERDNVTRAAWATPGVTGVQNLLSIA